MKEIADNQPASQASILPEEEAENRVARNNALLYMATNSLSGAAAPLSIALGGLAGVYLLEADKSLATLPVTSFNIGTALMALPAAMLMRKIGRRLGFSSGSLIGMAGMLLAVYALFLQSFWLFCLALCLNGMANSFTQQFRFAATDRGTQAYKPKAISIVLVGGVAAAIVGPQVILHFRDYLSPVPFAGAFLWAAGLFVMSIVTIQFLRSSKSALANEEKQDEASARPLKEIVLQPRYIAAVITGTVSFATMSFLMTAAPLAMIGCGFDVEASTWGIQWHVLAMFAPSFFTGHLIARFGASKIIAAGLYILAAAALIGTHGQSLTHFYSNLVLLGVGWNFGFIGSTAMLTRTYRPTERNKAQGVNDLVLFSSVALASLFSGITLNLSNWYIVNWGVFPFLAVAVIALFMAGRRLAPA